MQQKLFFFLSFALKIIFMSWWFHVQVSYISVLQKLSLEGDVHFECAGEEGYKLVWYRCVSKLAVVTQLPLAVQTEEVACWQSRAVVSAVACVYQACGGCGCHLFGLHRACAAALRRTWHAFGHKWSAEPLGISPHEWRQSHSIAKNKLPSKKQKKKVHHPIPSSYHEAGWASAFGKGFPLCRCQW